MLHYCSTITTWGKDGELEAFRNMLTQFPTGLVACVSDSYDIWNACEKVWGGELKDLVVQRGTTNSTLVVRPDSGDPPEVVVKVRVICGLGRCSYRVASMRVTVNKYSSSCIILLIVSDVTNLT